jgi:hypothetical protein
LTREVDRSLGVFSFHDPTKEMD